MKNNRIHWLALTRTSRCNLKPVERMADELDAGASQAEAHAWA